MAGFWQAEKFNKGAQPMKRITAAALALACIAALADTSVGADTYTSQSLRRGSTTVATVNPATPDACHARAQTDAEARHASASYTCGSIAFSVTYSAPPPMCPAQSPADVQKTIACSSPYYGTRQVTQSWTLHPLPTCWVNDGPITPAVDTVPPCTTTPPASYVTTFPLTENPISEGGAWINGGATGGNWHNVQTAGGIAFGTQIAQPAGAFDDSIAILSGYGPNQSATATLFKAPNWTGGLEAELLLRFSIANGNAHGYEVDLYQGQITLVRWNGPQANYTILANAYNNINNASGSVFYAEIFGSIITVKCNGNVVLTFDVQAYATANGGAYWASGNPGMGFYVDTNQGAQAPNNTIGWTDFRADQL
jgi:hypothetical protein